MKKLNRILSILLILTFMVSGLTGCSNKKQSENEKSTNTTSENTTTESTTTESTTTENTTTESTTTENTNSESTSSDAIVGNIPCKFPIVTEPLTLNVLASVGKVNYDDVYVWNKYEEMTGIDINWTQVQSSERKEKVATTLAGGEDIDLIIRTKISADMLAQYGDQGLIVDLMEDNMLATYAPNCWAYLQKHPDTLACITNPDGSIYALPQVNSGAELRVSRKLFINKTWLDNLGLELPTTTDELYDLLVAFKEQDANGNGDPNDEVPFCTQDWASFQDAFLGAFGLGNRGQHNQIVDWDYDTNSVRLIAADDSYKEMLQFMNKLYTEGLVDEELFTMTSANWTTKAADDRIGVFANTNLAGLPSGLSENWVGIEEALEGPNGDKLWAPVRANFHSTGNAIIPATCENVAEVLQWLDYFWTDEGTLFYHYGIEGETFVANEDGTYDYMDSVFEAAGAGASFDDAVATVSPYPGGGNPTVEVAPYFGGGEMAEVPAKTANALIAYGPEEYWPSFTFSSEENNELNIIQTDIKKYYESARTEFITGTKSFDDWDSYLEAMNAMNLDKMLEIYTAAVNRYHELMK